MTQTGAWLDGVLRVVRLGEEGSDGFHRSWIMLFPEGDFKHDSYGELHFTRRRLAEIKDNFDRRVRHIDVALDANHDQDKATGWLERLELRGGMPGAQGVPPGLWGLVRWTPLGEKLLREQIYRYFSPEFGPWVDPETGTRYKDVLIGGGLTNRPFLKTMPAVALSGGDSEDAMDMDDYGDTEMDDGSGDDAEAYDDGSDGDELDDDSDGMEFDDHPPMSGIHEHGEYGLHVHGNDNNHHNAPLAADLMRSMPAEGLAGRRGDAKHGDGHGIFLPPGLGGRKYSEDYGAGEVAEANTLDRWAQTIARRRGIKLNELSPDDRVKFYTMVERAKEGA